VIKILVLNNEADVSSMNQYKENELGKNEEEIASPVLSEIIDV
jgi:hypothetical protein